MTTLTEMVASVVLHSSAAAFSHFGATLEAPHAAPAPRVVARTPRKPDPAAALGKAAAGLDPAKTHVIRA